MSVGPEEVGRVVDSYVVRYVGGPLDGRVDSVARPRPEPRPTVKHVHLHGGPKIVHHYDLHYAVEYGCEYRLRVDDEDEVGGERGDDGACGGAGEG
ncbi:hypothetical protein [Actinosynnema pretiosum]|uniref:hypothetical protein n=1 Tax=Actinosynnema pretiosum TaxID=42197 RepID=UPI001E3B3BF2|nr:hypothetical protein [Actinosynnema pretiosum]